jgi:hypothetical protein
MRDRQGAKRVLVAGLLAQAFGALAYTFGAISTHYKLWRCCSASSTSATMPLYAVIAHDNFPLRMMGMVIGGTPWPAA